MSLEITLYTKTATKQKLISELKLQGYNSTKNIFDLENTQNNIGLMWFGTNDYESFVGVEANVIRASQEDREKYHCSEWILHTRTRSSGSYKDKEKQNLTIKCIRKLYGGTFYNDWYGTNTYTKLTDYPRLSAPERGLVLMRSNIHDKISNIKYSLSQFQNENRGQTTFFNSQSSEKVINYIYTSTFDDLASSWGDRDSGTLF